MEIDGEVYYTHIQIGTMQYCNGTIVVEDGHPHIMNYCNQCNVDVRHCQCSYCECCGVDKICNNSHKRCVLCYNFSIDCICYDSKCPKCNNYWHDCPCDFDMM